ncbi:hypothetical protein HOY82DRAFT_581011 [Tuber indicum]|nr:hypothetical protein HOY82DRAFT_581011 [Tuber indicum]
MKKGIQRHHRNDYDKDHQSPNRGSNGVDIDGDMEDEDDGNEGDIDGGQWADAEGDEDNHDSSSIHQQSTPPEDSDSLSSPKAMRANGGSGMLLPPPPADQRRIIRANGANRKRPVQPELQTTPAKKRRSTVKRSVRRADSSSGESNDVVLHEEIEYKGLDITNEEEVNTFFETRLRQMQQLVCKVVAKCWIKVIEPKKQSNFPYNRGEESKPSWWPPNARHKEPDHLMKPERLRLLLTMLRCRKVPVSKLEAATAEATAHIPPEKAPLLEEIYRVAKMEERYRSGGLAPGTLCFVAASEKIVKSPNQKVPSPKMNGDSSSPIIASSGALRNMGRRMSSAQSPGQSQLSPIITNGESGLRAAPRLNTDIVTGSIPHIQPQNPFRGNRGQSNVQPLNTQAGLGYSTNGYVSQTSPVPDEQYMDQNQLPLSYAHHYLVNPQQQQSAPHRNSIATSHGYPGANPPPAHSSLRRAHTSPNISQQSQSYAGWPPQMSNTPLVNGMYSPYSPNTQPQHSPHGSHGGHPSHGPQSASNPPTPVTATSYQPLPHPLPPMHQHQQSQLVTSPSHDIPGGDERGEQQFETPAMAGSIRSGSLQHQHHIGHVSYSDFLENEHDLGAVQENAVSVEDGQQGGRSK